MDIYDQEIIDWMNNCPTHKIEVQHADEHGAIFLVNFNNEKEEDEQASRPTNGPGLPGPCAMAGGARTMLQGPSGKRQAASNA